MEAEFGAGRNRAWNRARAAYGAGVCGVIGVDEKGGVAGIAGGHMCGEETGLAAGDDDDVGAGGLDAGAVTHALGDGVA